MAAATGPNVPKGSGAGLGRRSSLVTICGQVTGDGQIRMVKSGGSFAEGQPEVVRGAGLSASTSRLGLDMQNHERPAAFHVSRATDIIGADKVISQPSSKPMSLS